MTITDSPRLADPSHDTVRDPDWILARLARCRAEATRWADNYAAHRRDSGRPPGEEETAELMRFYLDDELKRFEAEIRVWGSAADALVETLDAVPLPPLDWYRRVNLHSVCQITAIPGSEHGNDERIRLAQQWAETLGLPEIEKTVSPGTRKWVGEMDGFEVSVWCITDPDAFWNRAKVPAPITDNDPNF